MLWSTPDPAIAPNSSPAGKRSHHSAKAAAPDTTTTIAISVIEEPPAAPRISGIDGATSPNSAKPPGIPVVRRRMLVVCTMAMAGKLPRSSVEGAITCAIEPGLAPSNADSRSQLCTRAQIGRVTTTMANVATITIAMLAGQAAKPLTVCGVITAPSRMPITT